MSSYDKKPKMTIEEIRALSNVTLLCTWGAVLAMFVVYSGMFFFVEQQKICIFGLMPGEIPGKMVCNDFPMQALAGLIWIWAACSFFISHTVFQKII